MIQRRVDTREVVVNLHHFAPRMRRRLDLKQAPRGRANAHAPARRVTSESPSPSGACRRRSSRREGSTDSGCAESALPPSSDRPWTVSPVPAATTRGGLTQQYWEHPDDQPIRVVDDPDAHSLPRGDVQETSIVRQPKSEHLDLVDRIMIPSCLISSRLNEANPKRQLLPDGVSVRRGIAS